MHSAPAFTSAAATGRSIILPSPIEPQPLPSPSSWQPWSSHRFGGNMATSPAPAIPGRPSAPKLDSGAAASRSMAYSFHGKHEPSSAYLYQEEPRSSLGFSRGMDTPRTSVPVNHSSYALPLRSTSSQSPLPREESQPTQSFNRNMETSRATMGTVNDHLGSDSPPGPGRLSFQEAPRSSHVPNTSLESPQAIADRYSDNLSPLGPRSARPFSHREGPRSNYGPSRGTDTLQSTAGVSRALPVPTFDATARFVPYPVTRRVGNHPINRASDRPSNRSSNCLGGRTTRSQTQPKPPSSTGQKVPGTHCMFVNECDTGSQLRKAISHIFGRNKTCTRTIPADVWVHYCRKHYQRCRYKGGVFWSDLQCILVGKQIKRVQEWSDANSRAGNGPVVQSWSLSMRKREKERVQDRLEANRTYDPSSDDEAGADTATLNGTAVPEWLRELCNEEYDTTRIQEIVSQIRVEILDSTLSQIPDIEILPNITTISSNPAPAALSENAGNFHRRTRSAGIDH
ncbi:hypothetical protein GGR52DRAFT_110823 [Hypoxylon sp. FL1284]|nr:hypothetical protein GGR52DRAFT_110823 [Hypoxylon sp. FL1284]